MEEISSYQMILQKRKELVIAGRSDIDMYAACTYLCKEEARKIWFHEYLVIIKEDKKNQGKWKIEIIENNFVGKDNTVKPRNSGHPK